MPNHLTVSTNGGPPSTGAITCTWEDAVRFRLNNTAGVRSVRYELHGYPPGWAAPGGWTFVNASRLYYSEALEPADIALPAEASGQWGKWLTRLYVNGQLVDESTALEIVSPNGLHATPAGEQGQFGGEAEQWGRDLEANWRVVDELLSGGGGGSVGELSGDVTGLPSSTTVGAMRGYQIDFGGEPPIHGGLLVGEEVAPGDVRIRQIASPPDDPPTMLVGTGLGPPSWTSYFPDFFAFTGIVGGPSGLSFGATQIDISGSGTVTLSAAQLATGVIRLAGTLTGSRVVRLPSLPGMRAMFCGEALGNFPLRIESVNGGFTYLLPRQRRQLCQDALGILVGEALNVLATELSISLIGDLVGDTARAIATLPGPFVIDRCDQITLVNTAGGTSRSSVGQNPAGASPQYSDLLQQVITPLSSADPLGKAASSLGTAMATDGSAFFASTKTIFHNHSVSAAPIGDGKIRLFLVARYLGE